MWTLKTCPNSNRTLPVGWCLSFCWFSGSYFQLRDDELQQPTLEILRTNELKWRIIKPDLIQTIQKPYQITQNLTKPYPKKHGIDAVGLEDKKIDCTWLYQIVLVLVTPGTHMKPNCRTLALRISLKADAKRPSRAACSSVSRASQNGALLNILRSSLKHFEAVWSTLKQLETVGAGTVWSSLKLTGAKHSITWHNFEASRRRDSTSACLVSTSSTCPIVTAGITLSNSYVAKNRICKCQIKHAYILQHEE